MPDKISVTFTVNSHAEARELEQAWQEIVKGKKLVHAEALERGQDAIMERARLALERIENAISQNPGSGQVGRLVSFLAGVYNGGDYPFDLTDLRALDTELANACLDFLNYDRLCKQEVHHHLKGGERALHGWLEYRGIRPALRFSGRQQEDIAQISTRSGREPRELFDEAVDDLIDKYNRKAATTPKA